MVEKLIYSPTGSRYTFRRSYSRCNFNSYADQAF